MDLEYDLNVGAEVQWHGVSRVHTGKISGLHRLGYIVSMDNGKCVIVAEISLAAGK